MKIILALAIRFWWVVLLVVLGVGALIFRDVLSGSASDLRVGDCFDLPADQTATTVKDVQHHPCGDAHDAEVVHVVSYEPAPTALPSSSLIDSFAASKCIPAFESYTGRTWATDAELDMGYMSPLAEGWQKGDHDITCYVLRIDGAKLTTSVRAAP